MCTHLGSKRDGVVQIPLHEAGEGGISKKCRVRCGRQQHAFEEDSEVTETTCNATPEDLRLILFPCSNVPHLPHLLSQMLDDLASRGHPKHLLRKCGASFVERDSRRTVPLLLTPRRTL